MVSVGAVGGGGASSGSAVQISTGGYEVAASGTVVTADASGITFQLEGQLAVEMTFINDGGASRIAGNPEGASKLRLNLYNFNNSLGVGTSSPMEIGQLRGRRLYIAFNIYSFTPESSKTVHYTFLLGGPRT